jgi:hypothetical protein
METGKSTKFRNFYGETLNNLPDHRTYHFIDEKHIVNKDVYNDRVRTDPLTGAGQVYFCQRYLPGGVQFSWYHSMPTKRRSGDALQHRPGKRKGRLVHGMYRAFTQH